MEQLKDIDFEITSDGSVGLYSKTVGDIFHSKTGALKEANEKFINPLLRFLSYFPNKINILDICYGIGYNTKAAIETFKDFDLTIDALEYNKNFIYLSPFINDGIENDDLKYFIISQIFNSISENTDIGDILQEITNKNYDNFISAFTRRFIESLDINEDVLSCGEDKQSLLHNIYYEYISKSMKSYLKSNYYKNKSINYFLGDARKSIFQTNNLYDVIFLDAFSPQKDATLWTIDFLSVLKMKMKPNSILLSYSKSAPFRSALLQLGFFVGKTFIDNIDMGTVASNNSNFILKKLDNNDFNVIETRSGIPYRDINLSLPSSSIIINRSIEGAASDRISRTQFQKIY